MPLNFNAFSARGPLLVPLSVVLGLGIASVAQAQPLSGVSVTEKPTVHSAADHTDTQRRVKACAAPCRHKPSSMR